MPCTASPPRSLLFVDDHPLYREGIQRTLIEAMPDLRIRLADEPAGALAVLRQHADTDLCLSDYRLPRSDGLTLLAAIGTEFPGVARGLLCAALTPELVQQAIQLGCVACLSKSRNAEGLAHALRQLFDGGTIFDRATTENGERVLTTKRLEVLRLAAQGMTNKGIARRLGIAERSVKDHWTHLFEQLQVNTRAEAVAVAYRSNLL